MKSNMHANHIIFFLMASLFSSLPVFAESNEDFFKYAKESINEMEKANELNGQTKHEVMRKMLNVKNLTYECSWMRFSEITYDDCVMSFDVMRLPDDRTGAFIAGMAGAAAERVAGRVYDRVIDNGLDRVERKVENVRREIETRDRQERERRATERERNSRCNHSVPSYREGDCA